MNKQLKKKIEQELMDTMTQVLTAFDSSASLKTKKKVKEAGKMVAKKFLKAMVPNGKVQVTVKNNATTKAATKKVKGGVANTVRSKNGRFSAKKK